MIFIINKLINNNIVLSIENIYFEISSILQTLNSI